MNLTLPQRREIVVEFKSGKSISEIWAAIPGDSSYQMIEQTIRDFMLRKFKLKEKKR